MPSIEITDKKVREERNGLVVLDFHLSTKVLPAWKDLFDQTPGGRSGPGQYVNGPDPQIVEAQMIEWAVPESAMADAVRHVQQRVGDANRKWEQLLAQHQESREKSNEGERAKQARLDELQKRLDEIE